MGIAALFCSRAKEREKETRRVELRSWGIQSTQRKEANFGIQQGLGTISNRVSTKKKRNSRKQGKRNCSGKGFGGLREGLYWTKGGKCNPLSRSKFGGLTSDIRGNGKERDLLADRKRKKSFFEGKKLLVRT